MKFLTYILPILITTVARGQTAPPAEWFGINVLVHLKNKMEWSNEFGYRTFTSSFMRYQHFARFSLRYHAFANTSLATGLSFFNTRQSLEERETEFGYEFRLHEEIVNTQALSSSLALLNRLRVEQRFMQSTSQREAHLKHRGRYQIVLQWKFQERWFLSPALEYMAALDKNMLTMDQLRLLTWLSFNPSWQYRITLGIHYHIRPQYNQMVYQFLFIKSIGKHDHHHQTS